MPSYKIQVTEYITNTYKPVWVEAVNQAEARETAEEMRVQGYLESQSGDGIDEVDHEILAEVDGE